MRALCAEIRRRYGRVDGIVHGAGLIEDKLLPDKQSDSWSRVVETKVMGLLALLRHLNPEALRFLVVFSSVAGRYGNTGQSDYAAANELMNRLCCQLAAQWGDRVRVKALCWGPWGPTRFGTGMVSAETERKFAEKGVTLVSAEAGRQLFREEICSRDDAVEVVCGDGPWEQREAAVGAIRGPAGAVARRIGSALLSDASLTSLPKGEQIVALSLDANHLYLRQHLIDGVPILPAAVALELMAEAVVCLWPGWHVVEIRDAQLIKGIDANTWGRRLAVEIRPPPYGSSEGFDVKVRLRSDESGARPIEHYRAVLHLEARFPAGFSQVARLHSEKKLTAARAYERYLFHGPCFQVIENIDGLSATGARSRVRTTQPAAWLARVPPEQNRWVFDPALLDAAAQMAILWARSFRDETALPVSFARVVRFRDVLPDQLIMDFDCSGSDEPGMVRADVRFLDSDGQVVLLVEGMTAVSSHALNRLGGTAIGAATVAG
jgi:NAD(P)-dependent dehydrogenase (short-subunit alcohol dehydrogenase family)